MNVSAFIRGGPASRPVRPATVRDVSVCCGVSTATVSRVINGATNVSPKTRNKVLQVVRKLGFTRNHAARSLIRRRTDTIGIVFPEIEGTYFSEVLRGINEQAENLGYHTLVAFDKHCTEEDTYATECLLAGCVDALVLMNLDQSDDFMCKAAARDVPVVVIGPAVEGSAVSSVTIDNLSGADAAMTHLLELGYQRIAVIRGPEKTVDADQRLAGCFRAADRAGYVLPQHMIWSGDFTWKCGYQLMVDWIDSGCQMPEAVFALNDGMALGLLSALRERGAEVPKDVALVGFDDSRTAKYLGLSTVRSPLGEIGAVAAEITIGLITGELDRTDRVLPTELIVRSSSSAGSGRLTSKDSDAHSCWPELCGAHKGVDFRELVQGKEVDIPLS